MQSVEAAFEQRDAVAAKFAALFDHRLEQRLHGVAQLAHGHDAGHARATLDGVQVALQPDQRLALGGALAQLREQAVGMIKQVTGLLDEDVDKLGVQVAKIEGRIGIPGGGERAGRSEEHTSELQSLMRISYAVFCMKKPKNR